MTEITQDKFGAKHGNCYAACIASIFELDLSKLPSVPDKDEDLLVNYPIKNPEYFDIRESYNECWHDMWNKWFSENNLKPLILDASKFTRYDRSKFSGIYHILVGPSPRDPDQNMNRLGGMTHAVVGKSGLILWDPHPSRAGLLAIDEIELIVLVDPAKPILEGYHKPAPPPPSPSTIIKK